MGHDVDKGEGCQAWGLGGAGSGGKLVGQLGESPWRSLRLGGRGQGKAHMGCLGSGLEVVKGPDAFRKEERQGGPTERG